MQGNSFDIVLKISERCNLACPYCYYYFQEFSSESKSRLITEEVIAELPRFLKRSAERLNLERINIVLHGGEPLLIKPKKADKICQLISDELRGLVDVTFAVQTNGVLISEEWIDVFKKHNIIVGVSIDGLPEVHDKLRPDLKGKGSFQRTLKGYRLLDEMMGDNPTHGALGVLHLSDEEDKMLAYMIDELGVPSPNLNFPRGGWDSDDAVKFGQSIENHRKLIRHYLDNYVHPKYRFVRGITGHIFSLMSDEGAEEVDYRASCRHNIATISSEGDVYIDDNILGLDDSFSADILNIFDDSSLKDLVTGPLWTELMEAIDDVPAECGECEWFRSCRGGDLFNRFSEKRRFNNKSVMCDTIKMFHEEIVNYLVKNRVCTLEEIADRLSKTPTDSSRERLASMLQQ